MEETQEKEHSWQFFKWIFKVLYSPVKTFGEIAKKPNVKGPVLILLITLPLILSVQYISGTKFFLESPTPENDPWTEKLSGPVWSSNDNITFDENDYIIGNSSVSSSINDSSLIWMHLTNIGSFICSEEEYNRLSFRIKWMNEANVTPTSATLLLFSFSNESKRFELDISDVVANRTAVWANVSVNLVTDDWASENAPSWVNVTGIGFRLVWNDPQNLTLKIDDLFFGKYVPISSSDDFDLQLVYSVMRSGVDFLLEWLILFGIVLLSLKSFSDWDGVWKDLFSTVGYVYSVFIVYLGALVLLSFVLPPIFLPFNITYLEYLDLYQGSWGIPISVLSLLSYGWTTVLCTVALKNVHELSWGKAFLIGFGAVVMSLLFSSFLLDAFF